MKYKFSIITPEHDSNNISNLIELYESICEQTYENWEWIIYLNNGAQASLVPKFISDNPKVSVSMQLYGSKNIGTIKNNAFKEATGDILVEVDHDDLITLNCLEKLNEAFQNEEIGFVYSDCAVLHMLNQFVPYDPRYGWTYRMFDWKGQSLYAMNSFEPSSQALSYIWYAPDHVRAWRKSVYQEIGGHNRDLEICDDHELMIRTYLKTHMKHIPEVLYIYRVTGNNTWLKRNQEIQNKTKELFRIYARSLAERDADLKGLLKVDIGGGFNPYPGYFTIDLRKDANIVHDLNDGIPLPDNSVGVLHASHILEHLYDKTKIMSEIYRVLAHGGWAFIEVPSTDGRGAFQDPTHVSYWNENSFWYYTDKALADYIDNTSIKFMEFRKDTIYPNEWMRTHNICVTNAWLVAHKDGPRLPHTLNI